MSNPLSDLEQKLRFPVVAVSRAGWTKTADEVGDLTDASPDDDLRDWQGMEIYDSAGQRFVAQRAFRGWPRSSFGAFVCLLMRHAIHVALELDEGSHVSVDGLKERLAPAYGGRQYFDGSTTHEEVIERA